MLFSPFRRLTPITIEKEIKKQKTASKNQLSILDEINKQVTQ